MLRRAVVTIVCLVFLPATVQAFDHHHHHHHHHSGSDHGGGCGGSSEEASPSGGSRGMVTPPPSAPEKHVFVTATSYAGAIGGLDAADAYCTSSARAAGLTGSYRAWLSDATTAAPTRVDGDGPWLTTHDELAFASHDALGAPPAIALRDENGQSLAPNVEPWSGTDAAKNATGLDCEGWTNATSEASGTVGLAGNVLGCDAKAPLLCFEE